MTREQIRSLAEKLNVKDEEVSEMETRLSGHDIALETQHDDDDDNFAPIAYLSSEQTEARRGFWKPNSMIACNRKVWLKHWTNWMTGQNGSSRPAG